MDYSTFLGEVQNRAGLSAREDALSVTRITLETLSERLGSDEADNLAAQLPKEISRDLKEGTGVERFSWDEFVDRLGEKGDYEMRDERASAIHHARVVMAVVSEAVDEGEMADVRDQLPAEYDDLFVGADRDTQPVDEEQQSENAS
jgi:uncharacterized protein (DUF2267 family)